MFSFNEIEKKMADWKIGLV